MFSGLNCSHVWRKCAPFSTSGSGCSFADTAPFHSRSRSFGQRCCQGTIPRVTLYQYVGNGVFDLPVLTRVQCWPISSVLRTRLFLSLPVTLLLSFLSLSFLSLSLSLPHSLHEHTHTHTHKRTHTQKVKTPAHVRSESRSPSDITSTSSSGADSLGQSKATPPNRESARASDAIDQWLILKGSIRSAQNDI
jgi:hypothetical protein